MRLATRAAGSILFLLRGICSKRLSSGCALAVEVERILCFPLNGVVQGFRARGLFAYYMVEFDAELLVRILRATEYTSTSSADAQSLPHPKSFGA